MFALDPSAPVTRQRRVVTRSALDDVHVDVTEGDGATQPGPHGSRPRSIVLVEQDYARGLCAAAARDVREDGSAAGGGRRKECRMGHEVL
jgi:hypothetical protein